MPRTVRLQLPGDKTVDVTAPDGMSNDEIEARARAQYKLPPRGGTPVPTGPLTPEEQAAPTMTAGAKPGLFSRVLESIKSGDAPRVFARGAGFGLPEAGASAIDAAANPDRSPKGFGARFREGQDITGAETDSARAGTPGAPGVELAGGVMSPAAKVLGAASALAKARNLPLAARALVGTGEAAAGSGAVAAAENLDHPVQSAHEAMNSPWNLAGAAGPVLEKGIPALADLLRKRAATRAARSVPVTEEGVGKLRQVFGDIAGHGGAEPGASDWLRDAKLRDGTTIIAANDKPRQIADKLKMLEQESGTDKTKFVEIADQLGAKVDLNDIMTRIMDVFKDANTPGTRIMKPKTPDALAKTIGRIMDEAGWKGPGVTPANPPLRRFSDWESLKTSIQNEVSDRIASGKINTPVQEALGKISSIIKGADEAALGKVWGPDMVEAFVKSKDQFARATTYRKLAEKAANASDAENTKSGSIFKKLIYPALAGATGYGTLHSPELAIGAAGLGAGAEAWSRANPTATRLYDALGKATGKVPTDPITQRLQALAQAGRGVSQ